MYVIASFYTINVVHEFFSMLISNVTNFGKIQ